MLTVSELRAVRGVFRIITDTSQLLINDTRNLFHESSKLSENHSVQTTV